MNKQGFIGKYGDELVCFSSYYKYMFTFEGELSTGETISVSVGGNSDDIYRFEVSSSPVKISDLDIEYGGLYANGKTILSF